MRYIYFTLALLSFSISGQAQYTTTEDSDPAALDLLRTIKAKYLSDKAHKLNFELDMEFPGQSMETEKGSLIQLYDKFDLNMGGRRIISDSETVWMYLEDINEVQINDADFEDTEDFMSPTEIFNLDQSKDFIFAITEYGRENGREVTYVECKPVSTSSEYSKMRLAVYTGSNEVHSLKIFSKDASRFTLRITDYQPDVPVGAGTFSFDVDAHDGVHVEDLRF